VRGGGYKENVQENKYGGNYYVLLCENGKVSPVETIPGTGERQ
jgi:hypothetical protein